MPYYAVSFFFTGSLLLVHFCPIFQGVLFVVKFGAVYLPLWMAHFQKCAQICIHLHRSILFLIYCQCSLAPVSQ